MERKYSCNDPLANLENLSLTRRSTIGYQTEQLNHIDYVIGEIVLQTNFKMGAFVAACIQYPQIKDQTKLIHEIFLRPNFVHDLIRFLMVPEKMVAKFGLSDDDARRYVTTIAGFLKENYEFYEYYFLSLEKGTLELEKWFQFLNEPQASSLYTSLGYLYDVFLPFVKYEFSTSSRITEYFEKRALDRGILLIDHFEQGLLKRMLQATEYEAVFKVLLNLVLVSLQEQEWKKSLALLKALCLSGISLGATLDTHVESLFLMVREVDNNIDKDVNNTIFAFINVFVQTDLVRASITRIISLFETSQSMKNAGIFSLEEEWALQSNFKLLGEIINLYSQLRDYGVDPTATQMMKLKQSITQVYLSFGRILKLIRKCNYRSLNFSNGENIRSIGLYRHEFLNLLRISLQLIKQHGLACPQLLPTLDKSEILQFLTRCLSENRWNSIVHCTIEKIVCLMINTEFFKKRGAFIRRFLLFIVQAFSNKKYMFLNSAKMINQGDIHSLYFISRKITVELDRMPVIVDATNDFDFWKDFVLKVLQKYEHFSEERSSKVEWEEEDKDKDKENGDFRVEIDEVALIKEIVKKIEVNKKWSFKKDSHSTMYRIGSASQLKKLRTSQKAAKASTPGLPSKFRVSINEQKPMASINEGMSETSLISIKGMSINEEKEMSASSHSSEEQVMLLSAHSDADKLEEEAKFDPKKMTQSGW